MQEIPLNSRYKSIDKIGQGSFGEILKVYDIIDKKLRAVKIEKKDRRGAQGMLKKEIHIMHSMKDCHHFPKLIHEASTEEMTYVIMSYLGQNLESLKNKYTRLSVYTTLLIGYQMLEALRLMHSHGFLHRDIKPENFVIGTEGNHHNVYIIDFGLSKQFLDLSGKHIPEDSNKGLVGTARYTSINSHKGFEQSRRDDLEALGYVLVYLCKGELPWQNLNLEKREDKFEMIKKLKIEISTSELCSGLPECFSAFMNHSKGLAFREEPDYQMLQQLFLSEVKSIQKREGLPVASSHCLDWCGATCSIRKAFQEQISHRQRLEQIEKQKLIEAETIATAAACSEPASTSALLKSKIQSLEDSDEFVDEIIQQSTAVQIRNFDASMFKSEFSQQPNSMLNVSYSQGLNLKIGINKSGFEAGNASTALMSPLPSMVLENTNLNSNYQNDHSENSSEYNNMSCEYCPQSQDEQVQVQKVISSNSTKLARTPVKSTQSQANSYQNNKNISDQIKPLFLTK